MKRVGWRGDGVYIVGGRKGRNGEGGERNAVEGYRRKDGGKGCCGSSVGNLMADSRRNGAPHKAGVDDLSCILISRGLGASDSTLASRVAPSSPSLWFASTLLVSQQLAATLRLLRDTLPSSDTCTRNIHSIPLIHGVRG